MAAKKIARSIVSRGEASQLNVIVTAPPLVLTHSYISRKNSLEGILHSCPLKYASKTAGTTCAGRSGRVYYIVSENI